jgi:ppGpp synthetase/RelA/SpoT-type nucleotidyltranferase
MLSKSKVDRIGDKLRRGAVDAEALTRLSEYQSEFDPTYKYVERILTRHMYLTITGRPAKSTLSIVEKLRRINSRLSQMQDIAGCRTIVLNLSAREDVVRRAKEWFHSVEVDDKRSRPTHGYRAVHLLVYHGGKCVEVQVRTRIQHFWATVSEKLSDTYGQEIKYGEGNEGVRQRLIDLSDNAARFDAAVDELHANQEQSLAAKREARGGDFRAFKRKMKSLEKDVREVMYSARSILLEFDKMEAARVLSNKL